HSGGGMAEVHLALFAKALRPVLRDDGLREVRELAGRKGRSLQPPESAGLAQHGRRAGLQMEIRTIAARERPQPLDELDDDGTRRRLDLTDGDAAPRPRLTSLRLACLRRRPPGLRRARGA